MVAVVVVVKIRNSEEIARKYTKVIHLDHDSVFTRILFWPQLFKERITLSTG